MLRRSRIRVRHLTAELELLGYQMKGRAPAGQGSLSTLGVLTDVLGDAAYVLAPRDVGMNNFTAASGVDCVIVPAGIYSRLPQAGRAELLRSLTVERLVVMALPRELMGPLPRQLGRMRRVTAGVGLEIGRDGDAMVPVATAAAPGYVHYFRALELSAELRGARPGGIVAVVRVASAGGPLLMGSVTAAKP